MCGESRKHGVEWGKTWRLLQRVTYHYEIELAKKYRSDYFEEMEE